MRSSLVSVVLIAIVATLVGCSGEPEPYAKYDPHFAYPTTAKRQTAYLDMAPLQQAIPVPADRTRIDEFLTAYQRQGEAPISVNVTAPTASDPLARQQAQETAIWLQKRGVAAADIHLYVIESPVTAGPQLTFPIYVTESRECGNWTSSVENDHDSANTDNFGCAVQKNIDAMAANPRDLIKPEDSSGRDGGRAWKIVDNYQQGKSIPGANDIRADVNYTIGTTQSSGGGQ